MLIFLVMVVAFVDVDVGGDQMQLELLHDRCQLCFREDSVFLLGIPSLPFSSSSSSSSFIPSVVEDLLEKEVVVFGLQQSGFSPKTGLRQVQQSIQDDDATLLQSVVVRVVLQL